MSVPSLLSIFGNSGSADPVYVDDIFSTFVYEGNDTARSINNGIDLAGEGGLVWIKQRDGSRSNILTDTESGASKHLVSNSDAAQVTNNNVLTAFNSNGFNLGTTYDVNQSPTDFVSWTFRKQKGFFDVVTYSGDSDSSRTISHNLGSIPGMIMIKGLQANRDWVVHHRSVGFTKYLVLNSAGDSNNISGRISAADASTFTPGSDSDTNQTGKTYVAYLFAHDEASFGTDGDESIIKCGSYTGTGLNGRATVDIGFEPQWVLIKGTERSNTYWIILDNIRGAGDDGQDQPYISANSANSESSPPGGGLRAFITNNGFGWRDQGDSIQVDKTGEEYIYMAIRRQHKPPEVATEVFAVDTGGLTSPSPPQFTSNFPVDWVIQKQTISGSGNWRVRTRLLGRKKLITNDTDQEDSDSAGQLAFTNGYRNSNSVNADDISYMFKRATGFFDVVNYVGSTTLTQNVSHQLGVVPEIMIIKNRFAATNWIVYHTGIGATKFIRLNTDQDPSSSGELAWNNTAPTASVFTLGNNGWDGTNYNGNNYIAFLFATLPGVSKVGTYTGTGNAVNVDCGFTNGARFILIKRTASSSDWYLWDTVRGIVSGNDPYLRPNRTNEQVTNTDYVDPLAAGFTVTSSAPAALNTSGGSYIFLAIA